MRIVTWDEAIAGAFGLEPPPAAATIGVFDGVHRGHRELVRRVLKKAPGKVPVAVTFRENPKRVTAPHRFAGDLFTLDQKLEALDDLGLTVCVLIDFSGDFSKLGGNEFISTLVGSCGVRFFAVGSDFKCGYRLSTDAHDVREIAAGFHAEVDVVEPVLVDGEKVSSSGIRAAVTRGRMDLALAMLGRPYTLDLRGLETESNHGLLDVVPGKRGFVLPRFGNYVGTLVTDSRKSVVSISVRHGHIRARADFLEGRPLFLEFDPEHDYTKQGE